MATKKTVARKRSDEDENKETVRKLSRQAYAELAKLLKRNRLGTITRRELDAGLEEVEDRLDKIMSHTHRL